MGWMKCWFSACFGVGSFGTAWFRVLKTKHHSPPTHPRLPCPSLTHATLSLRTRNAERLRIVPRTVLCGDSFRCEFCPVLSSPTVAGWPVLPQSGALTLYSMGSWTSESTTQSIGCNILRLYSVAKPRAGFESCSIINLPGIQG